MAVTDLARRLAPLFRPQAGRPGRPVLAATVPLVALSVLALLVLWLWGSLSLREVFMALGLMLLVPVVALCAAVVVILVALQAFVLWDVTPISLREIRDHARTYIWAILAALLLLSVLGALSTIAGAL